MATRHRFPVPWRRVTAVFAGGVVGGAARMAVSAAVPSDGGMPWATLVANVSGAFLLGFLLTRFLHSPRRHPLTVPLLGTGALGSYTTFSGFSLEIWDLFDSGQVGTAVSYGLGSIVLGLAAAVIGLRLGERAP